MNKTLLIKCLTALMLLAVQISPVDAQITVSFSRKPLKEALQIVEKQSGYSFFYSNSLAGLNSIVSLNAADKDINYIMRTLLTGLPIDY